VVGADSDQFAGEISRFFEENLGGYQRGAAQASGARSGPMRRAGVGFRSLTSDVECADKTFGTLLP
jgi:hypothetical protein